MSCCKVEIYSESAEQWLAAEIVRIFSDDEGEWVEVQYTAGTDHRLKQVPRDSPDDIRPVVPHEKKKSFFKRDRKNKSRRERHSIHRSPSPRSSNWKSIEFSEDHYAKPVVVDTHNLLIACGDMNENVYTFDMNKQELKVLFRYPRDDAGKLPFGVTTCVDHNRSCILFYCTFSSSKENLLLEYDQSSRQVTKLRGGLKDTGAFPVMVCLSGQMHLLGGRLNSLHLVWDAPSKSFTERPFRSKMLHGHGVIALESTKQLLVLGGNDSHLWGGYLGSIWVCEFCASIL